MISTPARAWITAFLGQESQRERISIAIERHRLRLSQRFELGQQPLVEPGQVDEKDDEHRSNGGTTNESVRDRFALGIGLSREEMEARVGIEPA